jgi:hypothetical protein
VGEKLSRLRQRARHSHEERGRLLDLLLSEGAGLVRGALGTRARRCGKSGCRCTRGELHVSKYLSVAVDGRTRLVHVPAGDEATIANAVERYHMWRDRRGELAELDAQIIKLLDLLGDELLASYPPHNPVPPPRRRRRKGTRKSGGSGSAT